MTPWLVLGVALGVLFLPFAVVAAMYWMIFLLRALHGLRASMRAFRQEMEAYRLWHEGAPSQAPRPVAPPPDYGPEPVRVEPASAEAEEARQSAREEVERRLHFPGLAPRRPPESTLDTDFREPARPTGDYDDFSEEGPVPVVAPGSKLAAPPPPGPGS